MAERNETLENEQTVREYFEKLGWKVTKLDIDRGVVRKYRPDFLIRLATGDMLILETKPSKTASSGNTLTSGSRRSISKAGLDAGGGMWRSSRGMCWTS